MEPNTPPLGAPPLETPLRNIFRTGAVINSRYSILQRVGGGATGAVFKALDLHNAEQIVALKSLTTGDAEDPVTTQRFKNEVTLAQQLHHPNIIEIYELNQTDSGQLFMSMEFVEGETLRERIREQSCTFIDVISILRDIALALEYAHSQNVVHRDLKPDNILIRKDDQVKIVDLGLARNMAAGHSLTKTGEALGTPHYMAPEQIQGVRVDGRADIYALGIIGYELVVGVPPFIDKTDYRELVYAHLCNPLPDFSTKSLIVSAVPSWYEDFVCVCAEKDPADRYPTMSQVARTIEKRMVQMGLMQGVFQPQERGISRWLKKFLGVAR